MYIKDCAGVGESGHLNTKGTQQYVNMFEHVINESGKKKHKKFL